MDAVPEDSTCLIDRSQQRMNAWMEELLCFSLPEILSIPMYAVILMKLFQREKQNKHGKITSHGMTASTPKPHRGGPPRGLRRCGAVCGAVCTPLVPKVKRFRF
ncbi:hypothetical protein BV898_15804 [Hypsibius exemplaris]|uniref:G-protein coupled receptors family 1 profile domain-containing protein n=1 Tax=Hypsibius exemplaris TaxID=2072580 RepID=A0A9X6NBZ1_HYPEX|nr:hypothetical protein BV898_15804 [Hypsibius exemplaris]